jgi:hypothetical protein
MVALMDDHICLAYVIEGAILILSHKIEIELSPSRKEALDLNYHCLFTYALLLWLHGLNFLTPIR